jgi:hypothetical protein
VAFLAACTGVLAQWFYRLQILLPCASHLILRGLHHPMTSPQYLGALYDGGLVQKIRASGRLKHLPLSMISPCEFVEIVTVFKVSCPQNPHQQI